MNIATITKLTLFLTKVQYAISCWDYETDDVFEVETFGNSIMVKFYEQYESMWFELKANTEFSDCRFFQDGNKLLIVKDVL